MKPRFKNDNGRWLTISLFYETANKSGAQDDRDCLFTLQEEDRVEDGRTYKSLYKLYMQEKDIHEVLFAKKYLGGIKHWRALVDTPILKRHFLEWREELELILMAEGFRSLKNSLDKGDAKAAKYFSDRGWDVGISQVPGRDHPGKLKTSTLKEQVLTSSSFLNDVVEEDFKKLQEHTTREREKEGCLN